MTIVSKVGLGFIATGVVVGFLTNALGLQHLKKPIWVSLGVLCFVTVFAISLRTRTRKPPK
jgi:type III secretory pathway component EscR